MDGCFGYMEIKALQSLLSPPKDDSDSDDDLQQMTAKKLGPSDIGPSKTIRDETVRPHALLQGPNDDIWHASEADTRGVETNDPRIVPEYEMRFKQNVGTEDVFLGIGFKTPGTASCEWLCVEVKLPQETRERIDLAVESDSIDLRSPRYRLHLPTPHPVEPNSSAATWRPDTSTLEITLKLRRDLDPLNF